MKKIILNLVLLSSMLTAAAQKDIINDPNAEVRSISGSFSSIKISDGIDLFLSQGEEEAVAVSAVESKYRDGIKAEVNGGQLRIYYANDKGWNNFKNRHLRAYVSFKTLTKLEATGASDVQVSGVINVPSLALSMSGASDFKGAVDISGDLKINLSGASDITIKGVAQKVDIESSGASDVKGFDLAADYCTAKASGASDIHITVNKELTAHASGASDIRYKGEAKIVEQHTGGASSVSKKG
ncbi:MAG: head GIN domain-containing protein [Ferruginibacter sp.]